MNLTCFPELPLQTSHIEYQSMSLRLSSLMERLDLARYNSLAVNTALSMKQQNAAALGRTLIDAELRRVCQYFLH